MLLRGNYNSSLRVVLLKCGAAADGRIGLLILPTPSIPQKLRPESKAPSKPLNKRATLSSGNLRRLTSHIKFSIICVIDCHFPTIANFDVVG